MTKTIWTITIATILLAGIVAPALTNNAFATISGGEVDKTTFLTDTGATSIGAVPNLGNVGNTVATTIGTTEFKSASGSLYMGGSTILSGLGFNSDWTSLIPLNSMAISNVESLDVTFDSSVYSAGFDFVEPSCNRSECSGEQAGDIGTNVNNGFVDSEFTVTLKLGLTTVDTFTFNAQNDVATFVGVTSDSPFDKMEIRETTGASENEYFGEFYTSSLPPVPPNEIPDCSAAEPSKALLWPPNHKFVSITIDGVTDGDDDSISLTIEGITQDEELNAKGKGDGNTSPDGVIDGDTAEVRAERAGTGDGRVYEISFTADDGNGGSCTGSVTVGVPHDKKDTPVDSIVRIDSTQ
jgi:hypothetical protein